MHHILLLWRTIPTLSLLFVLTAPLTAAQDGDACAPTRLEVWAQAQVPLGDRINRLRAAPSTVAQTLDEIPAGVSFDILDGPVCEGDILWWEVESRGQTGWTAESQGDDYFLERIGNNCPPSALVANGGATFANPDVNTINRHVRPRLESPATPYTDSSPSIHLDDNTVCVQDARWWFVDTPDGPGWMTESVRDVRRLKPFPRLSREDVGEIVAPPTNAPTLDPTGYTLAWRSPLPNNIAGTIPHVWTVTVGGEADALSGPIGRSEIDLHWSPDGTRLAYQVILGGGRRNVLIDALDGSEPLAIEADLKGFLGFTPDGTRLLWRTEEDIDDYRLQDFGYTDIATGEHMLLPDAPDGFYHFLRWTDDTTFEALRYDREGTNMSRVAVSLDGSATVLDASWGFDLNTPRSWTATGNGRYAFTPLDSIVLFDPATRATNEVWNLERLESPLSWSPDGTRLAYVAGRDDQVYVLDVTTGEAVVLPGSEVYFAHDDPPVWSPDGLFVAYMSREQTIVMQQADGGAPPIEVATSMGEGFFDVEDLQFRPGTPE